MKITVFGLGYVGATSAVLLSNSSEVYAVDTDTRKIDIMNHGLPAINDSAMKTLMERGNLSFTATGDAEAATINAEYIIIAIPILFPNFHKFLSSRCGRKMLG